MTMVHVVVLFLHGFDTKAMSSTKQTRVIENKQVFLCYFRTKDNNVVEKY